MATEQIAILNGETGEMITREMTKDEYAEHLAITNQLKKDKEMAADAAAKLEQSKIAAQDKLAALGLTSDDLKALGL